MLDPNGVSGRLLLVVALLAVATLGWWLSSEVSGRFRPGRRAESPGSLRRLTADDLGAPLGERGTFVQFSTATCATCPRVARTLTDLVGSGVVHVEVDADQRMDLVRAWHVRRSPTVLLLDPRGRVVSRSSGPVRRADADAALSELVAPTSVGGSHA